MNRTNNDILGHRAVPSDRCGGPGHKPRCAAGSHTCMSGTLCRSYNGAVPLCAGRRPGKMVGTCTLFGRVLPASQHRRSAFLRQLLRFEGGRLEVPGMIGARQVSRRTVGSRRCRP
jgi:hypothetical protein